MGFHSLPVHEPGGSTAARWSIICTASSQLSTTDGQSVSPSGQLAVGAGGRTPENVVVGLAFERFAVLAVVEGDELAKVAVGQRAVGRGEGGGRGSQQGAQHGGGPVDGARPVASAIVPELGLHRVGGRLELSVVVAGIRVGALRD